MFTVSQLTSRVLVHRVDGKVLMLTGISLAGAGFLLATRLDASSPYLLVLACLLLVGTGNGLSVVSLTTAGLAGVPPQDAGAASGLVNVTQQLGGTVGVAVLVTVFGSASRHAGGSASHAFIVGAGSAFTASTLFLVAALVLVAAVVRSPRLAH